MNCFKNEKINKELIDDFKSVIHKDYGKKISEKESLESFTNIIGFIQVLIEIYESSSTENDSIKVNKECVKTMEEE